MVEGTRGHTQRGGTEEGAGECEMIVTEELTCIWKMA